MTQKGSLLARLGRGSVFALDALLRRCYGVYEFTRDPACILRLSLMRSRQGVALADGTYIRPGDLLAVIHFWNERLPPMPPGGPDLRWARQILRHLKPSLQLVAEHLASKPDLAPVRAVCGEATFLQASDLGGGEDLLSRLGFEIRPASRGGAWGRFATFWQNAYSWALIWAFNPASLRRRKAWDLERYWLYMSRATLQEQYGPRGSAA